MRRVLALVLSGLFAATTGCSGEATVTTTPASSAPAREAAPAVVQSTPIPSRPASAAVGAAIDLSGLEDGEKLAVTLVKVVDPARAKNPYSTPEAGARYVAVQFRLKNTGTAVYQDSPSNGAKVVDAQGQQFSPAYTETSAGPEFPGSITIAPGDTALGFITFEVPGTSEIAKVHFSMNSGFSPHTGQWNVP
ncbi:DUF4352 domain-containing protein [Streptomyces sp. NPDC091273]|uniref:DUF4352 domain-containing protein n=1 Tax=Streptomyces sp. NPDC091273 TaxID=3365982 RepID=UPI0037F57B40